MRGETNSQKKIAQQTWTLQNLNKSNFNNGDPIPEAKSEVEMWNAILNEEPAWCYYDFNPNNDEKFGKLYNWYAVIDERGLAPTGFKIPTMDDWEKLVVNLGGHGVAGPKMKSSEWNGATNESGLKIQPGGIGGFYDEDDSSTYGLNIFTGFWAIEEDVDELEPAACTVESEYIEIDTAGTEHIYYIRCIKESTGKQIGDYELNDLYGSFGYIREGDGKVVYLFNDDVDHELTSKIAAFAYGNEETARSEFNWSEMDPSILNTLHAGELLDENSFNDIIEIIDVDGPDIYKFITLLSEDILNENVPLIYIDSSNKNIKQLTSKNQIVEIVNLYKENLSIYIREYDHAEDY